MEQLRFSCDEKQLKAIVRKKEHDTLVLLLHRLLDTGRAALTALEVNHVLTSVLDGSIDIYNAERGMILLFDKDGEVVFKAEQNLFKENLALPAFEVTRTMIDNVSTRGIPMCLCHGPADSAQHVKNKTENSSILSAICLPLKHDSKVFGVIYLDNQKAHGRFEPNTCLFFREFVDFISLTAHHALEHNQLHNQVQTLEAELRGKYHFESIVGHHPKIVEILQLVAQVADTDATVLIQGESGTGKELIAHILHYNSRRKKKSLVPVSCAALPEHLLESELFGHVRGAFTGAIKDSAGWFERADGSTIFLDEINDMSPALQVKLLRILQTGEYSRVGSTEIHHCDVRVLAATSKGLQELVKEGKFREELYYRLNIIELWLPPLRDRKYDIPLLAQHFLRLYGAKYGKPHLHLSKETEMLLLTYEFPGNIRELENTIQRAVIFTEGDTVTPDQLPAYLYQERRVSTSNDHSVTFKTARKQIVEQFEYDYIVDCLRSARGNISRAAQSADLHVTSLYTKLKKYGIDPDAFKV